MSTTLIRPAPPPADTVPHPPAAETGSWDLVYAAQRGDREAFAQLWLRYRPIVAGYVRSRVRDHALAEDFTAETFARALGALGSVRDQGCDAGAWLTRIARNLIYDHAKRHSTWREVTGLDVTAVADSLPSQSGSDVERVVLAGLDAAELGERVAALIPDQRQVIGLRFGRDLSVPETAAAMGRSVPAVKSLQHRALTWLRKEPTAWAGAS